MQTSCSSMALSSLVSDAAYPMDGYSAAIRALTAGAELTEVRMLFSVP